MKKILVIGSGGAGKSTFANRLGNTLNIEVIHLDKAYWKPNWVKTPKEEWAKIVEEFIAGESWIMDGNFGGTLELRMRGCDTIIFLDIPRRVCLYRILKRVFRYHGKTRPDMAEGCNEKVDLEFVLWVWNYPHHSRPHIQSHLKRFAEKNIVIISSTRELELFLQNL